MRANRHVPAIIGAAALAGAAVVLWSFGDGWRWFVAVPLAIFGWVSLKTAWSASDQEIRELTGASPLSKETARRFEDRL